MEATLEAAPPAIAPISKRARLAGRIITAVPALFLSFDAVMKLAHHPAVAEASARLGLPEHTSRTIGLLEIACLALYLTPRTAMLGAVLLTGFLGGAVAIHVRVGDPLATHTLFPVYVGAMSWVGLALRDGRARAALVR